MGHEDGTGDYYGRGGLVHPGEAYRPLHGVDYRDSRTVPRVLVGLPGMGPVLGVEFLAVEFASEA